MHVGMPLLSTQYTQSEQQSHAKMLVQFLYKQSLGSFETFLSTNRTLQQMLNMFIDRIVFCVVVHLRMYI